MKKLSYEDGQLVLRSEDGTLFWSSHRIDIKGSFGDGKESDDGGYKEVWIEGMLIETSDFKSGCTRTVL